MTRTQLPRNSATRGTPSGLRPSNAAWDPARSVSPHVSALGAGGTAQTTATAQRLAAFVPGQVVASRDLTDLVLYGTPAGLTLPYLNGQAILNAAQARAAVHWPHVVFSAAPQGGVNVRVTQVPVNTGSYHESTLARGRWVKRVPKATVHARFPGLAACNAPDDSVFRARGVPSDNHMYAANRRHEDRHAADHAAAFHMAFANWDARLAHAHAHNQQFHGADAGAALSAMYGAMGGTPHQIAELYETGCRFRGHLFHSSPAGAGIHVYNSAARHNCLVSTADAFNPMP